MAKKQIATRISEETYVQIVAKAEAEQLSVMKWLENACIAALNPDSAPSNVRVSDFGPISTEKTAPYNPCWDGAKRMEVLS